MASVLIITTILNIVVSVLVNSERQPSPRFSPNEQLSYDDQKDVDRRMDTVAGGHQVRREELNTNMAGNEWSKSRDKRAILYLINQRTASEVLFRMPKTTQNPFIRETNIDDYDIGGPADVEHVPQASDAGSDIDSHQLVRMGQDLFKISQLIKRKNKLSYAIENLPDKIKKNAYEDLHIRVKRKMSEFRRDRKQITRKKKIGRRKKTKVRRLPVKKRKWYDKRQKVAKKGDGTYRGGRGRIPRQHKRPRHYKPPKNESSVYDYYGDDGKVKVAPGETQEGSDDAQYVEYGTGEYEDTAEAEAAQQELEKEYQMQLVRERRRRLMNGTISSEESMFQHTNESVSEYEDTYSDSASQGSEYDTEYEDNETDGDKSGDTSDNRGSRPEKNINTPSKNKRPKRELDEKQRNHNDARLIAKRLNVMSLSKNPIVQNSVHTKQIPNNNRISSLQFSLPIKHAFKTIQSMPQQKVPDVLSMTKSEITSVGGTELHNLQSKRLSVGIETASKGKQITSIAGDKPETAMIFTSSVKDTGTRITSIGKGNFRKIQSMSVDPLVLTSVAKDIPDLSFSEENAKKMAGENTVKEKMKAKGDKFLSDKIDSRLAFSRQDKSELSTNQNTLNLKKGSHRYVRSIPISKQKFSGSYEELLTVPDGVGLSALSDEVEPASSDST